MKQNIRKRILPLLLLSVYHLAFPQLVSYALDPDPYIINHYVSGKATPEKRVVYKLDKPASEAALKKIAQQKWFSEGLEDSVILFTGVPYTYFSNTPPPAATANAYEGSGEYAKAIYHKNTGEIEIKMLADPAKFQLLWDHMGEQKKEVVGWWTEFICFSEVNANQRVVALLKKNEEYFLCIKQFAIGKEETKENITTLTEPFTKLSENTFKVNRRSLIIKENGDAWLKDSWQDGWDYLSKQAGYPVSEAPAPVKDTTFLKGFEEIRLGQNSKKIKKFLLGKARLPFYYQNKKCLPQDSIREMKKPTYFLKTSEIKSFEPFSQYLGCTTQGAFVRLDESETPIEFTFPILKTALHTDDLYNRICKQLGPPQEGIYESETGAYNCTWKSGKFRLNALTYDMAYNLPPFTIVHYYLAEE